MPTISADIATRIAEKLLHILVIVPLLGFYVTLCHKSDTPSPITKIRRYNTVAFYKVDLTDSTFRFVLFTLFMKM